MSNSGGKSNKVNLSKLKKETVIADSSNVVLDFVQQYWKYLIVVLPIIFGLTLYKQTSSVIRNLINAKDDVLKEAIFGDKPHLFYCDREVPNSAAKKDNVLQGLPDSFTQLNNIKGHEVNFAVLNCSQTLPSGKTIFERFQLKKDVKPIIFGSAPWLLKPAQLLPQHMKNMDVMRRHIEDALFTPKSIGIKSDKDFHSVCAFAKNVVNDDRDVSHTCFVLIKGDKYAQDAKLHDEFEKRLVLDYPQARFVTVNAKQMRLSFEDVEALPFDHFALGLHAIRNASHFLSMKNPITWDYLDNFVSRAVSAPLYEFEKHQQKDAVRLIKPAKLAKKMAKQKLMEEKQKKNEQQKEENKLKKKDAAAAKRREAEKVRQAEAAKKAAAAKESLRNEKNDEKNEEIDLDLDEQPQTTTTRQDNEEKVKERDAETERFERMQQEQRRREEMERQAREQVFETRDTDEDDTAEEEEEEEHLIEL